MLISTPREIESLVRKVRKGRLVTVKQLMEKLADLHDADLTCPLTTGIFLQVVAGAAEEEAAAGRKRVTPYWRVLKEGGYLNPKYPGGAELQAERLMEEGHTLVQGGGKKPPRVVDYESRLQRI